MKIGFGVALWTALLAGTSASAQTPAKAAPVEVTAENAERLRQAGAEILFWSQAERDDRFPRMEKLFPGNVARHSDTPYPLADGTPLDLGAGDPAGAYMAANNVAGLIRCV